VNRSPAVVIGPAASTASGRADLSAGPEGVDTGTRSSPDASHVTPEMRHAVITRWRVPLRRGGVLRQRRRRSCRSRSWSASRPLLLRESGRRRSTNLSTTESTPGPRPGPRQSRLPNLIRQRRAPNMVVLGDRHQSGFDGRGARDLGSGSVPRFLEVTVDRAAAGCVDALHGHRCPVCIRQTRDFRPQSALLLGSNRWSCRTVQGDHWSCESGSALTTRTSLTADGSRL
jgi:hypothetical protein